MPGLNASRPAPLPTPRRPQVHGAHLYSQGAKTVRVWELSSFACVGVVQAADIRGSLKAMAVGPGGWLYVGGQVGTPSYLL